jgi:hypothetical protein
MYIDPNSVRHTVCLASNRCHAILFSFTSHSSPHILWISPPKRGGGFSRPVRRTEAPWRQRPHHPGDRIRLSPDSVCSCFGPAMAKTVQKPCKGRRITEGLPQENRGDHSHRFPSLDPAIPSRLREALGRSFYCSAIKGRRRCLICPSIPEGLPQ